MIKKNVKSESYFRFILVLKGAVCNDRYRWLNIQEVKNNSFCEEYNENKKNYTNIESRFSFL